MSELWSFIRRVMLQGSDIQLDYQAGKYGGYEEYSARVDEAARERTDELLPLIPLMAKEQAPAWSQEAPVKPGWYWLQCTQTELLTVVYLMTCPLVTRRTDLWCSAYGFVDTIDGSWAGPIVPPEGTR